jgi:hypothetical protein
MVDGDPSTTPPFESMTVGDDVVVTVPDPTDGEMVVGGGTTTGGADVGDVDGALVGFNFYLFIRQ